MKPSAQARVTDWCQTHPRILKYLESLNLNKVDWAIYAGASVSLLTGSRQPTDIDIIVFDSAFERVRELSPKDADDTQGPAVYCGDGVVLDFPRKGLVFRLDGADIEVMDTGDAGYDGHVYHLNMSRLSASRRLSCEVDGIKVYLYNPVDTIAIKSVVQRGAEQNKFDLQDVQSLHRSCDIDYGYLAARAKEIGLDGRAWEFLERAGLRTPSIYSKIIPVNN